MLRAAVVAAVVVGIFGAPIHAQALRSPTVSAVRTPAARATSGPSQRRHVASPVATPPTPSAKASASPSPTPVRPTPVVDADDLRRLRERALVFPVPVVSPGTVRDTFGDRRGAAAHEALDVPAPRGAPVVAVDDGVVAKIFTSVAGGLTVYIFDDARRYAYYYAHLDGYVEGLDAGRRVRRGEVLGWVGSTGNAAAEVPHLHFAIFKLEAEPRWWVGTAIDPYPLLVPPSR
jgi:murein DD-endopeptidase MepM/ murein hydrolase activator NlpD